MSINPVSGKRAIWLSSLLLSTAFVLVSTLHQAVAEEPEPAQVTLDLREARELESKLWLIVSGEKQIEDERSYLDSINWEDVRRYPSFSLALTVMTVAAKDEVLREQIAATIARNGINPRYFWEAGNSNWGIRNLASILWGDEQLREVSIELGNTTYSGKFKSAFLDCLPVFLKLRSDNQPQEGSWYDQYSAVVQPLREVLDLSVLDIFSQYLLKD